MLQVFMTHFRPRFSTLMVSQWSAVQHICATAERVDIGEELEAIFSQLAGADEWLARTVP
jgi:hypothetical protein